MRELEPEYRATPEQESEANRYYWKAVVVSSVAILVFLITLPLLLLSIAQWLHLPPSWLAGVQKGSSGGIGGMVFPLAQLLAGVACRRKGVSLEARFRETWNVRRAGAVMVDETSEPVILRANRQAGTALCVVSVLFAALLACYGYIIEPLAPWQEVCAGATVIGCVWGAVLLAFGARVEAVLDSDGVTANTAPWYSPRKRSRRLAWRDITHLEIVRHRSVLGKSAGASLAASGKDGTTLTVNLARAVPGDWQAFVDAARRETRRESPAPTSVKEPAPVVPTYTVPTEETKQWLQQR